MITWDEAKQTIKSFRELKPDWDSYDALPIEPNAIKRAIELLDVLRAAGYDCPVVMPKNVGGVILDWDDWEITVEADECPGD